MKEENWLVAFATLLGDRMGDLAANSAADGAAPAAGAALSASARALLLTVEHWQPITVSEAAEVLGISQPTATRLADGLERAGLLHRGAKVERAVPLLLTAAGRNRAEEITNAMQARMGALLDVLEEKERRAFTRAVAKILAAATHSRAEARTTCRNCDHAICTGVDCPVGSRATEIEAEIEAEMEAG
jgi:DNA-binding MarR family transcriptional regulator